MALATGATISILRVRVGAFTAISLAYCLYAALFIYRTSFVINGAQYFALFDDEMVSMRYAKDLTGRPRPAREGTP